MSPPKCTVKDAWFAKTDPNGHLYSDWGERFSATIVRCRRCASDVSVEKKGMQALEQHAGTTKHKNTMSAALSPQQLTLAACTSSAGDRGAEAAPSTGTAQENRPAMVQLTLQNPKSKALRAELIWAMKCIQSSFSANSCEGIVEVFREMFGSEPTKDMSLGRTKVTYLWTFALGPHFRSEMLEDAKLAVSFTLAYDETTNEKGVKELQVGLRFYSEKNKEVVFHHLETFFIGGAKADVVFNLLLRAVGNALLCLGNMLMLSSDGPNVNKSILNLFVKKLKLEYDRDLMKIGFCNLHILHSGFQSGLSVFGIDVSELAVLVYDFFKYPNRKEEYEKSQELKNVPYHSFLKHVSSRWLTLGPASERLQEQWPAMRHYFLKVLPLKKGKDAETLLQSKCCQAIAGALRDDLYPAKLAFVLYSATLFERFSKVFQLEQPMIHVLYQEVSNLYVLLLSRFCKSDVLKTISECMREDFISDSKNFVEVKKVEIGKKAEELSKASGSDLDSLKFHQQAREHYQKAATYVLRKSILNTGKDAIHLRCLQPQEIKETRSVRAIVSVYKMTKLTLGGVEEDNLRDEWKLLQLEDLPEFKSGMRIDHYWNQIFELKDFEGKAKYPAITKVVKAILPAAHGSADVERRFSESRNQLPADRAAMEEQTLNARLNIRDGMRKNGGQAHAVPITAPLLKAAASASEKYHQFQASERQKAADKLRQQEEEEAARKQREQDEAAQSEKRKELDVLQKDLKSATEREEGDREAALKLVSESNLQLKKALQKNDLKAAKVAQGMLEGAQAMLKRAEEVKQKEAEPLRKKVEKRTNNLLVSLFKNHKRRRQDDNPDDPEPVA